MRESVVPSTAMVSERENLTDSVFRHAEEFPDEAVFRVPAGDGWSDVSCAAFATQVAAVAKGLIASGIGHGDRVALLSATRYEWCLIDYAIWCAGAVTVPVYESSSSAQLEWILADSGAVAIIVEKPRHADLLAKVHAEVGDVGTVWQIEGGSPAVEVLSRAGAGVGDDALAQRRAQTVAEDLATLVYTSGTTGRPKGCELTHRNLLAEARTVIPCFAGQLRPGQSTLSFLPMAHIFARVINVGALEARVVVGHTSDVQNLVVTLASFRPSFLIAVPRVLEKVYNSARQKAAAGGRGRIFDIADATAVAYSTALDAGGPGLALTLRHAVFDRLVYSKLRAVLGGRCEVAIAGGAPLGARLGHFFRGIGLPVYEGYGLTETAAAVTANRPGHHRIGTVGAALPACGVRIAEDGEVEVQGEMILRGYWHNEQASAESFHDGWLRTGDLGSLDDEGYLTITGRKKEIIVTAGGKNVAPAALEDSLRAHPLVSQCMVVGDQRPYIGAVVTIDQDAFAPWATEHGLTGASVSSSVDDAALRAEIDGAVARANEAVSHAEQIKRYRILATDFTEEGGELTPSMKLKRAVVAERYADEIATIYR